VGVALAGLAYFVLRLVSDPEAAVQLGRSLLSRGRGAAQGSIAVYPRTTPAQAAQCRQNLRMIEAAKRRVAEREGRPVGAISQRELLSAMGGQIPACPSGGTYTIGDIGVLPRCSIGAARPGDARDDHILTRF